MAITSVCGTENQGSIPCARTKIYIKDVVVYERYNSVGELIETEYKLFKDILDANYFVYEMHKQARYIVYYYKRISLEQLRDIDEERNHDLVGRNITFREI